MKIWVLSDLHLEVGTWEPPAIPDADICIAAGDIARGGKWHVDWLHDYVAPHMPVVSVLGNHEFYRSSIERERAAAGQAAAARDGIEVLDDMTWTVGDVRFVGATLWTDYAIYSDGDEGHRRRYMQAAALGLNDHRLIWQGPDRMDRFRPMDALTLHRRSRAYLESVLAEPFDGETVVVTHHCPHLDSIHPRFAGDKCTPAFCSDLSDLIERYQPAAWVHGHTHSCFDYHVGGTRVVCNPRGYPNENKDFDPGLVIEIGGYRPKPPGL